MASDLTVIGHSDLITNFSGDLQYLTIPARNAQVTMAGLKSLRPILVIASFCPYNYDTARPWPASEGWQRWAGFRTAIEASPTFRIVERFDQLKVDDREHIQLLLHLEGVDILANPDELEHLVAFGGRAVALTWNAGNQYAGGAFSQGKLTELGAVFLERMQRLGLWLDISHLNEESFWQVLERYSGPIFASHSNVRELAVTPRNLTRRQLHGLRERQAWVGVSFARSHLTDRPTSSIDDALRHIDHLREDLGENLVGLGTDWGGICQPPANLTTVGDLPNLFEALSARGEQAFIVKLQGQNFLDWWQRQER